MKEDVRVALGALLLTLLIVLSAYSSWNARSISASEETPTPHLSSVGRVCYDCHLQVTADVVHRLQDGKHIQNGVDCISCHDATGKDDRPDVQDHYGYRIITLVTLQDCEGCHAREIPSPK
jgi:hypothetical protein